MFETFDVPSLYVGVSAALELLSTGRTTGMVCRIGTGATHAVPIYEGFTMNNESFRAAFGGNILTRFMQSLLAREGHDLNCPCDF